MLQQFQELSQHYITSATQKHTTTKPAHHSSTANYNFKTFLHHLQHGVGVAGLRLVLVEQGLHLAQELGVHLVDEDVRDALALRALHPRRRHDRVADHTGHLSGEIWSRVDGGLSNDTPHCTEKQRRATNNKALLRYTHNVATQMSKGNRINTTQLMKLTLGV